VAVENIGDDLGWLGRFWATDGPASAQLTHDLVGWSATGPSLLTDLATGSYF
jgi:hypothetical protein